MPLTQGGKKPVESFAYAQLPSSVRRLAEDTAVAIRGLLASTTSNVIQIGLRLRLVREQLGRASFHDWLRSEFEWSQPVASNYMRAALLFSEVNCLESFQPSALFILARRNVPETTRQRAILLARQGELITKAKAQAMVDSHPRSGPRWNLTRRLQVTLAQLESRLKEARPDEVASILDELRRFLSRIEERNSTTLELG